MNDLENKIKLNISQLETMLKEADEYIEAGIDIHTQDGKTFSEYEWCHTGIRDIYYGKLLALKELINN